MLTIPEDFFISKRAPNLGENTWLYDIMSTKYKKYENSNVLEFGCGITSLVLHQSVNPKNHIAIEPFQPCVDSCEKYIPNIKLIGGVVNIPEQNLIFDIVLVDSSAGGDGSWIRSYPEKKGYGRDDSVDRGLQFSNDNTMFILHDIRNEKMLYKLAIRYLEDKGYEMKDYKHAGRRGYGIFLKA